MFERYREFCANREQKGQYRELPQVGKACETPWLDFSTNDYLGLSQHPALLRAAIAAAKTHGVGATGSRLLSGNSAIFEQFEARIAADKRTEAALLFNSGYQANATALASLLDTQVLKQRPLVFFDKLNHASLYQAVFHSGAELVRYHHLDMHHLNDCLQRFCTVSRPKFIVSETVFGMDGDMASMDDLALLTRQHDALLYLDEAHAVGLWGSNAYGLSSVLMAQDIPFVAMGTLSKALGCVGAYLACPASIKHYLINKAPGFIYSTANSPMLVAAAEKAWTMVPDFAPARAALFKRARWLRERLHGLGFQIELSDSPIIPLPVAATTLHATHQRLLAAGIRVALIRPPTVPPGTERLRIALTVLHTDTDMQRLLHTLGDDVA